ncbi:glycosyl transferase [bacterium]|nr:glycosyl transferase [bacterium]
MKARTIRVGSRIFPVFLAKCRYRALQGHWPQLDNPKTFDEKLLWLMLYWRHPIKSYCGDKYTMRSYVSANNLEHVLPDLHGVYQHSSQIDFESLPSQFVLKCTHGCKFNIVCDEKRLLDIEQTRRTLDKWMKIDYSTIAGELHYSTMEPRIICERYLGDINGKVPNDYKIYCFDGRAYCTMVCSQRNFDGQARYDFYNRAWNEKLSFSRSNPNADRVMARPDTYEEMIEVAEQLSQPFPFVRMDFYCVNGKTIISEMTFTPKGCIGTNFTDRAQQELGQMIELPNKLL